MKLNPRILSSALCSGILLGFTPAIFAEEDAAPEIMICPGVEIPEVVVPEIIVCPGVEIIDGVELNGNGESVITEEDTTTTTDEEVVVDEVVDSEETDDEVITWDIDWLERGEGGEEIYQMTAGGAIADASNSNVARVEADKETVVTARAEKATKHKTVKQNSAKPTAVKSNGRVFLLK